ncbi:methyltransferase [Mycolicibacterium arabiense]|nr:acetylserotonin O-methyltransferase [Mycolicibacterium arabiense]MCV7372201.1 methyltransferase [Mycolicibacterium arabiense]
MVEFIYGYAVSQTIRAFAELRIADHLGGGPVSAQDIASREDASPIFVGRLLRAGTALGLTVAVDDAVYAGTDVLATLRVDHPRSLRAQALSFTSEPMWKAWSQFVPTIRTGSTQAHLALGEDFFTYLGRHPEHGANFSAAMSSATAVWSDNITDVLDTSSVQCAVDVGGATGALLRRLQVANPALKGVVFDQPQVLDMARSETAAEGFPSRTDFFAGDFFDTAPVGDLYLLKFILHDWDDERCIEVLRRCREAMLPGGRVVVIDFVWDATNPSQVAAMSDVSMMLFLTGHERTLDEFDALFAAAGLRRTSVRPTRLPQFVIEAVAI